MAQQSVPQLLDSLKQAFATRDRARINEVVAGLVAQDAPIGNNWRSLADVMIHNGELTLARAAIDRFVRSTGDQPLARFARAAVLARIGDTAAAREEMAALPLDVPDTLGNAYTRGMIELNMGAGDEARVLFLRALAANPRSGQAWYALAMTGRRGGSDAIAQQIIDGERHMAAAPPLERAQYLYARGKVLDELGDHDAAFAAISQGAALLHADSGYDPALDARQAVEAVKGYTPELIARMGAMVSLPTNRTIFVTGSPRSGTTLIEQILASHSAVAGGEELGRFQLIGEEIGGFSADALNRFVSARRTPMPLTTLFEHLVTERFGSDGRVVDKTLDASRYLGLLAAILPEAPIIWLRRDALDRAWSCYRNYLLGVPWSYSQTAIGAHFRMEDELLDRWRGTLGDRLLVLDYEAVVSEPAVQIPRLMQHCGLPMEPQVLEPHRTQRTVTTSSVAQVRNPINRGAIHSGHVYRQHLQPFVDAYGYAD